jgi:type I restriction enzyme S subunit
MVQTLHRVLLGSHIGQETNRFYLFHYLQSNFIQDWISKQQIKGARFWEITLNRLRELPVIVPPLVLQNKFAQIVEKTEQQKQLLEKILTEMENNFNSLMQRAFRGDL